MSSRLRTELPGQEPPEPVLPGRALPEQALLEQALPGRALPEREPPALQRARCYKPLQPARLPRIAVKAKAVF
ncbi:MAG: hypothetical protein J4N94_00150 [Chloroflexi bacterium]|nr:hypothetical protein [Chloroflexota bacterium]